MATIAMPVAFFDPQARAASTHSGFRLSSMPTTPFNSTTSLSTRMLPKQYLSHSPLIPQQRQRPAWAPQPEKCQHKLKHVIFLSTRYHCCEGMDRSLRGMNIASASRHTILASFQVYHTSFLIHRLHLPYCCLLSSDSALKIHDRNSDCNTMHATSSSILRRCGRNN